jgi:hypothetical protein
MTGDSKPDNNKHIILIVALTLAVNATIGVCTLAYCMVYEKKVDVALFTAFVAIVNYILGVISGMLIKSSPTSSTPAEQSKPVGEIQVPAQKLETST